MSTPRGGYSFTADFDPGNGVFNLTSADGAIFVSKLDRDGNFVWARKLEAVSSSGYGPRVAVGGGSVYTTGQFSGVADFNPGNGSFQLTAFGDHDMFVSKLDSAGNFVWARQLGGEGNDTVNGVALDADGNVYTTGWFQGAADFDPGASVFNLTGANGLAFPFVSKLNSAGNFVWARQTGGFAYGGLAVDSTGNVYTTGSFVATDTDFDPSAGVFELTGPGHFVSKLDSGGNFIWARRTGGIAYGLAVDSTGNVYTTGFFAGAADFDLGEDVFTLNSAGSSDSDIFVFKLRAAGRQPRIAEGGIVLSTLLPTVSTISPLSIISVFGQNFSTDTILVPNLDGEGRVAKILGNTCLMMNGEALPIFAITPAQVNAQASAGNTLGPASFVVVTNCGTPSPLLSEAVTLSGVSPPPRALTSNDEMATVEGATPAFFLFPPRSDDGFIAARFNAVPGQPPVPVAPVDSFPDDSFGPSRPAVPGDIILLYGTGWGETEAGLSAGQLATAAARLNPDAYPSVTFGGVVMAGEDVIYVGATPNTAGLYQLAIRVPATAMPGNHQVVLTVYGKSTPLGPVIPVAAP